MTNNVQASQITKTDCSQDTIVFADQMLRNCITVAVINEDSIAYYDCSHYRHDYTNDIFPCIEAPDVIFSKDVANIDTIYFCDPPEPDKEMDIIEDLRKLSSLKNLVFMFTVSLRFRARLFWAMPKVRVADNRYPQDFDNEKFLEHHISLILSLLNSCWQKLLWALLRGRTVDNDKTFSVHFNNDTPLDLDTFFDD